MEGNLALGPFKAPRQEFSLKYAKRGKFLDETLVPGFKLWLNCF